MVPIRLLSSIPIDRLVLFLLGVDGLAKRETCRPVWLLRILAVIWIRWHMPWKKWRKSTSEWIKQWRTNFVVYAVEERCRYMSIITASDFKYWTEDRRIATEATTGRKYRDKIVKEFQNICHEVLVFPLPTSIFRSIHHSSFRLNRTHSRFQEQQQQNRKCSTSRWRKITTVA